MKLFLKRVHSTSEASLGVLRVAHEVVFTVEDTHRTIKVYGDTRIPAGTYDIKLRTQGRFHVQYSGIYGEMHKGMLWLQGVPGFEYIYIHHGNKASETLGCILVNDTADVRSCVGGSSRPAYRRIYPLIAKAILASERVTITITNEEV